MPDEQQQPLAVTSTIEPTAIHAPTDATPLQNDDSLEQKPSTTEAPPCNDDDRPNKRRKLTDSLTPQQRPSPRAVSPPWKRFAAEGPTTFVDSGRRRSGRTNALPLDLQPSSGKRRTRATGQQTNGSINSKYSSTPNKTPDVKQTSVSNTKAFSHHARTSNRTSQPTAPLSSSRARRQPPTPSTPTGRMKKSNGTANGHITQHRSARSHRHSLSVTGSTRGLNGRPGMTNGDAVDEVEDGDDDARSSEASGSGLSTFDSEEEGDLADYTPDPNAKLQKITFNVKRPVLSMTSYGNTLQFARETRLQWTKRHFESTEEYLSWAVENGHQVFPGYDIYEGDEEYLKEVMEDNEERRQHREIARTTRGPVSSYTPQQAREEAQLREDITKAQLPGGKLHPDTSTQSPPEKFQAVLVKAGYKRQYSSWDHTLAHAQNFHKLLNREQRNHRESAKRLAYAAKERWHAIQPRSHDEIEAEKQETHLLTVRATYQQCIRDISSKFDRLRMELEKVRIAKWQEEQEALGKQALNKVMEQSAMLLDARRRLGSGFGSDEERSDVDEGDDEGDDDSATGSELGEEAENMSSDDEEADEAESGEVDGDEKLTAEELRIKYREAQVHNLDRPPDADDEVQAMPDATETIGEDSEAPIDDPNGETSMQMDEASKRVYDEEADVSDESIDMSEEDSSDADEEDEKDGSEGSDEDQGLGLFSLIATKTQLKEVKEGKEITAAVKSEPDDEELADVDSPELNGNFDTYDDSELEEISLIPDSSAMRELSSAPDAAQVQTPAASHDEAGPEIPRAECHTEKPSKLSLVVTSSPPVPSQTDAIEKDDKSEIAMSLPATPVSSNGIKLKTPVPSLLRATLREYQHYGLDWLAGLYAKDTNGILADEMGLGKTIQTIALLAHVAEVYGIWGPHLIVVPTSVMLNWEVEFKKFLPGFKVLVYYGTPEERKNKRRGWKDDDKWNVVITSYQLVLQDTVSFKQRSWQYMVLDEAHNIKNWKSARWQNLLTFRTSHRLLLTGTPLQNNLTELWSLMFFLRPYAEDANGRPSFTGLEEFTGWFNKPVHQIMEQGRGELTDEAKELVQRLHTILRPFLLRRLKADVEKQMPGKYEHVVYCKLSKRQRYLYDGFMSRASTRETLAGGNYMSIINCLMQLRKVCNHPDLFETRQIVTSFAMTKSAVADYEISELLVRKRLLADDASEQLNLQAVNLLPAAAGSLTTMNTIRKQRLGALDRLKALISKHHPNLASELAYNGATVQSSLDSKRESAHQQAACFLDWQWNLQNMRSQQQPLMNTRTVDFIRRKLHQSNVRSKDLSLTVPQGGVNVLEYMERKHAIPLPPRPSAGVRYTQWLDYCTPTLLNLASSLQTRAMMMKPYVERFGCVTPAVIAHGIEQLSIGKSGIQVADDLRPALIEKARSRADPFHESQTRLSIAFPDKRLLQYDCGKLQRLDALLRTLQAGGHRALIFTQMTKVLDILEQFLNIHGHRYLRLDGSTKIEQRQSLTERFNGDKRILAFILSSRSGGLGINLTGADTVIFYDCDWNPAMDKQCQDRAHRIGQTRDVHIYRFVSEYTIEANILRKANQKRLLDDVIIKEGDFTTDHFTKPNPIDVEDDAAMHEADDEANAAMNRILGAGPSGEGASTKLLAVAEDKEDQQAAAIAEKEGHEDDVDFAEKSSEGPTRADTPKTSIPTPSILRPTPASGLVDGDEEARILTGRVQPRSVTGWQVFGDKAGIGVDRYILEHLEWELKDVPVAPPEEKNKKKRGRKGEQYTHKRRR